LTIILCVNLIIYITHWNIVGNYSTFFRYIPYVTQHGGGITDVDMGIKPVKSVTEVHCVISVLTCMNDYTDEQLQAVSYIYGSRIYC